MKYRTLELVTGLDRFNVIDIETTGLYYKSGARITDICVYKLVDDEVVGKFSTLVNPQVTIENDIEKLTGISNSMVKWAKPFYEIAQELVDFMGYDAIVGHNVRFDWDNFIIPSLKDMCNYEATNETICTMEIAKGIMKGTSDKKLSTVYRAITGKEPSVTHRAEADVAITTEMFKAMRKFMKENREYIAPFCK